MDHPELEDRYFVRMAASIGDKERILDWVLPGHVVDVGAGGGELTSALTALPGVEATALDLAPESLQRLSRHPEFATAYAVAGGDAERLTDRPADTVVFNAILHEVYSYSPDRFGAVDRALDQAARTIAGAGRIIIRDGIMPDRPQDPARFTAPDDAFVAEYLARSPHPELQLGRDGRWWTGTRHAVSEALLTLTWGPESLPREALERYEISGVDDHPRRLAARGFVTVHQETVTQPGYVQALAQYTVQSGDAEGVWVSWFPPTNGLWVFERSRDASTTGSES